MLLLKINQKKNLKIMKIKMKIKLMKIIIIINKNNNNKFLNLLIYFINKLLK